MATNINTQAEVMFDVQFGTAGERNQHHKALPRGQQSLQDVLTVQSPVNEVFVAINDPRNGTVASCFAKPGWTVEPTLGIRGLA